MPETRSRALKIRKPERRVPWGSIIITVTVVVALAIFGSWGFATFGA